MERNRANEDKSPRREPGDTALHHVPPAMPTGLAQRPGVPGLAPGAWMAKAKCPGSRAGLERASAGMEMSPSRVRLLRYSRGDMS